MYYRKKRAIKSSHLIFISSVFVVCVSLALTLVLYSSDNNVKAKSDYNGTYSLSYMPIIFDGYYMQGYFCDDKILISMDDMTRYGFEMNYDTENNVLNLRSTSYIEGTPSPQRIGCTDYKAVMSALDTRINGIKIDAYSLDGYACISIDELVALTDEYNVWWGWSDYNMNGGYNTETNTFEINNFRFCVNDWAALLNEMEAVVNSTEIDIYTEGEPEEAVYYGAKFEPRSGVYSGIVSDGNGDPEIGKPEVFHHDFGVYSSYLEFDEFQTDLNKPSSYIIPEKDCLNQVPWNVVDINLVLDDENNEYIKETLDNIAKYSKPTIIRFGAEMNIGNLGDSPAAYVKAFRKIADIIHSDYPNFAIMWSPNDNGSLDRPFWYYYPGDEYVDWIGVSSFSKKDFLGSLLFQDNPEVVTSREAQIYFTLGEFGYTTNSLKYITNFMSENNINKPLAISEGGVVSRVSYQTSGFDDRWGETRLRNMYWYSAMRYPQLKSIVYFNHDMETEVIGFDLAPKPNYQAIMEEAMQNGQYLLNYNETPKFAFVKADDGRLYSSNTIIPIYGYVYQPEEYTDFVEYILDGAVIDTQTQIPFKTNIYSNLIPDGVHTLTISAHGEKSVDTKTYTITKNGVYIKID